MNLLLYIESHSLSGLGGPLYETDHAMAQLYAAKTDDVILSVDDIILPHVRLRDSIDGIP